MYQTIREAMWSIFHIFKWTCGVVMLASERFHDPAVVKAALHRSDEMIKILHTSLHDAVVSSVFCEQCQYPHGLWLRVGGKEKKHSTFTTSMACSVNE